MKTYITKLIIGATTTVLLFCSSLLVIAKTDGNTISFAAAWQKVAAESDVIAA